MPESEAVTAITSSEAKWRATVTFSTNPDCVSYVEGSVPACSIHNAHCYWSGRVSSGVGGRGGGGARTFLRSAYTFS